MVIQDFTQRKKLKELSRIEHHYGCVSQIFKTTEVMKMLLKLWNDNLLAQTANLAKQTRQNIKKNLFEIHKQC